MKKLSIVLFSLFCLGQGISAQISVTYEYNALKEDDAVKTYITNYIDEGKAGKNQVWDFTGLQIKSGHQAEVLLPFQTPNSQDFPKANKVIKESGNFFYFYIDQNTNDFLGWVNKAAVIKLDKPSRKMVYPFRYGDKFSDNYLGHTVVSKIFGHFDVEADAYGTLKLPNNVTVKNVIRVKAVDQFVEEACTSVEFKTTKYLFYSEEYRYPLIVVFKRIENFSTSDKPNEMKYCVVAEHLLKQQAEDNPVDENEAEKPDYKVFPNPYTDVVKIEYQLKSKSKVHIDVYSVSGSHVATVVAGENQKAENYTYTFKPADYNLPPSTYIVKLRLGRFDFQEQIVGIDK
jgi:hypothetical protein